jgi:hypothetical protein
MTRKQSEAQSGLGRLLPLDPGMAPDELLQNLRMNALLAHQHSVGRGDELVQILKRTIGQMEKTHSRVQNMSTILFGAGLIIMAVAVGLIAFGGSGQEIWATLLGGTGGVATLVATFWTTPSEKLSDSISDLVKLEAAFLGYIRVIGEVDSAFQMQYLDILAGKGDSLANVINQATKQMRDIMELTLELIDKYVVGQGQTLSELQKQLEEMEKRLKALETPTPN